MFLAMSIEAYLEQAQSGVEVPGGGSVSALAAALGSCMGSMAANFTAGRKKYAAVEEEVQSILATLAGGRAELKQCVEDDAQAFLKFNDVYAMPKDTDAEKVARDTAMQAALNGAMQPPLRTMRAGVKCLEVLPRLAQIGNKNLVSDTGVSALLLQAGVEGARLNVAVNLKFLKDELLVQRTQDEVDLLLRRAADLAEETRVAVGL